MPAIDCDDAVKGHRRAFEPFDVASGYRFYEVVIGMPPNPALGTNQFGLSDGAAIPNSIRVWPQRFTWHSDYQVRSGFTHTASDFQYMLHQLVPPTANCPNTYTVYMNYERVRALRSANLRDHMKRQDELERTRLILEQQRRDTQKALEERERRSLKDRERARLANQVCGVFVRLPVWCMAVLGRLWFPLLMVG